MNTVYISMSAAFVDEEHINTILEVSQLGKLIIGLLTDTTLNKNGYPSKKNYEERKRIIENIKGVKEVIPQKSLSYKENIKKIKPKILIYNKKNRETENRYEIARILREWDGIIIEKSYSDYNDLIIRSGVTSTVRLKMLRQLLKVKPLIRVNEVHHGLSGLITENTRIKKNNINIEFDAMWSSSLTDSTAKGKPDIEAVDITSRITSINHILEVTTKPMIFDADTGGRSEHFSFTVRSLERLGVSAAVIEDKIGLKRNSLLGTSVLQQQDSIENFQYKINTGKVAQVTNDFMIISRIESLILEAGIQDAIDRAEAYIDANTDAIMIHSKLKKPNEIFEFCERYHRLKKTVPLMVVPSSFNTITEEEWMNRGVNIVCYANHMLRSSYPAMLKVAQSILENGRSLECNHNCLPIKEILELIPGTK